eukprot:2101958-Pyramimonas_sp.AAC.1
MPSQERASSRSSSAESSLRGRLYISRNRSCEWNPRESARRKWSWRWTTRWCPASTASGSTTALSLSSAAQYSRSG